MAFFTSGDILSVKAIGIDPGLAMTGFGIVETLSRGGKACDWGAIRTEANCPIPLRLKTIYDELKELLREVEAEPSRSGRGLCLETISEGSHPAGGGQRRDLSRGPGDGNPGNGGETDGGEECLDRKRSGR